MISIHKYIHIYIFCCVMLNLGGWVGPGEITGVISFIKKSLSRCSDQMAAVVSKSKSEKHTHAHTHTMRS